MWKFDDEDGIVKVYAPGELPEPTKTLEQQVAAGSVQCCGRRRVEPTDIANTGDDLLPVTSAPGTSSNQRPWIATATVTSVGMNYASVGRGSGSSLGDGEYAPERVM